MLRITSFVRGASFCVALSTPATAQQRAAVPAGTMDILARPVRLEGADVEYVQMRMQLMRDVNASEAAFSLQAPIVSGGIFGLAERLENVEIADVSGPVPVQIEDDTPSASGPPGSRGLGNRHWRATRPVAFPLTITYKARIWPPGTRSNPTFMLRAVQGSVSGRGYGFLLTPEDRVNYAAHFRWDMNDLPKGSSTASGLTDENDVSAPFSTLMNTYVMAGPLHRYPAKGDQDGFIGYWVGSPAWDVPHVMEWTARIYAYMRTFHSDTAPRVYRVIGRMYPPPAYGGSALDNHFVFNAPAASRDSTDQGPLLLLAHEIGHSFIRGLQNPGGGGGGGSNNWFSEGLNEYYAVALTLRSGLGPLDLVLGTMNSQARAYYTNPRRNMPADSVARIGLNDVNVQNVSYQRGLLFWADMDARIRAASKGRRNLDSVVVPMMARARAQTARGRAQGEQGSRAGGFTPDELVAALAKEIGPAARQQFDAVIVRGETIVPASNAFGPCFELRPAKLSTGNASAFDSTAAPRSPAGGGEIDGYLWFRVPAVPDERCRTW